MWSRHVGIWRAALHLNTRLSFRNCSIAITGGCLAGLLAYAFDVSLVRLTYGASVPIRFADQGLYVLVGSLAGLAAVVRLLSARKAIATTVSQRLATTIGVACAFTYVPALAERLAYGGLVAKWDWVALPLTLPLTALASLIGLEVLHRLGGSLCAAGLLLAIASAAVLALNRNVVGHPFSSEALILDSLLCLGTIVVARGLRWKVIRVAGSAGVLVAVTVALLIPSPEPDQVSNGLPEEVRQSPNLLLLVIDTLRYDVLEDVLNGTPEGELLRHHLAGSTWFESAIATAPWTAPTVASMMTGLYPQEHGVGAARDRELGRPLRPLAASVPTLATTLEEHGYSTAAFVTNPLLHPASGLHRGFRHYEHLPGTSSKLPLLTFFVKLDWVHRLDYQNAAEVRQRVERAAGSRTSRQPFFWWVHFLDPHVPLREHPDLTALPGDSEAETTIENLYRREVRFTVREIASLLASLDAVGRLDHTFVVLTSDHGEMLPSDRRFEQHSTDVRKHRSYGHGHALYDELVRIPLIVRPPPSIRASTPISQRSSILTSQVDLFVTFTELLGIEAHDEQDRYSLASVILPARFSPNRSTPTTKRHHALLGATQVSSGLVGLRTHKHKLINYMRGSPKTEVFLLRDDPLERRNVIPQRPELRARLQKQLQTAQSSLKQPPEPSADGPSDELQRALRALGYID